MAKEQILQKHFTAEFGHDGHGKFMQYILDAMEEYAQQQVKKLNEPAVIKSVCEHPWDQLESVMGDGVLCRKCNTVIKQTVL